VCSATSATAALARAPARLYYSGVISEAVRQPWRGNRGRPSPFGAVGRDALGTVETTIVADEVHVWRASLEQPGAVIEQLHGVLAADEIARAARFRFDRDRNRYIVGRGLLRTLLGGYLRRPPSMLRFEYGVFEKPRLAGEGPQFNLSHSGSLALLAFANDVEIGVDVEHSDVDFARERIAERFFSPAEVRVLRSLPEPLQPHAFLTCWTRKERSSRHAGTD